MNNIDPYNKFLQSINQGFCIIKLIFQDGVPVDYTFIEVNDAFEQQTGLTDAKNKNISSFAPSMENYWYETYGNVAVSGEPVIFQNYAGELERWFDVYAAPFGVPGENLVAVLFTDITKQKAAEIALNESEKLFQSTLDNFPDVIVFKDLEGKYIRFNKIFTDILGVSPETVKGATDFDLFPREAAERYRKTDHEIISSQKARVYEDVTILSDGIHYHMVTSFPLIDTNGRIYGVGHMAQDISAVRSAHKEIEERLNEKEVLLKELYHRTKNNLQVVSSLLNLKSSAHNNRVISEAFDEMRSRIHTIALVHEKLYQSHNLSILDMNQYIMDLGSLLISSHTSGTNNIKIIYELEQLKINIDTAVAAGLIITELFLNALKHAFPGGREGKITLKLKSLENNFIELTVSDNGVGMPEETGSDKLGLLLFRSLAAQIDAEVALDTSSGTSWQLRFPNIHGQTDTAASAG